MLPTPTLRMELPRPSFYRRLLPILLVVLVCFHMLGLTGQHSDVLSSGDSSPSDLPLSGLDAFLLVIKTGATESARKLPAHFNTTLKQWPHVLLLSDLSEQVNGHDVHDALDIVSSSVRESESFKLWRLLRRHGKSAFESREPETGEQIQWLSNVASARQAAWQLARFMNLPMAVKAYQHYPDVKWYTFVDADTFISGTNIRTMFEHLDHTQPHYFGAQTPMGPGQFFGHGGSGYVLSQGALARVVDLYLSQQETWDVLAAEGDFGEVPLARALLALGIHLGGVFPHLQGGNPHDMPFDAAHYGRTVWCYPAVTYHHVSSSELRSLFQFEESWPHERMYRHSDVFEHLIAPQIMGNTGDSWDNASIDPMPGINDAEECRDACRATPACVQFSFGEGQCRHDGSPKIGRTRAGWSSGWNMTRIDHLKEKLERRCEARIMV